MELTQEQKKEFINYCKKIGFIIPSVHDWSEDKKILKLHKLIAQGYRIRDYGDSFEVININGKSFSDKKQLMIENLYIWLLQEPNNG